MGGGAQTPVGLSGGLAASEGWGHGGREERGDGIGAGGPTYGRRAVASGGGDQAGGRPQMRAIGRPG